MDISNTTSRDVPYAKLESSENRIKQDVPQVIQNSNFKSKLTKIDSIDVINKAEKLEEISDSIEKSNRKLQLFDRKLEISVHEKTREVMIKVIDTATDQIIREIPPEKVLDIVASRKEIIGLLMDKMI